MLLGSLSSSVFGIDSISDGLSLNGASHMGRFKTRHLLKTNQPISLDPGLKFSLNLKAKQGSVVSDKNI